MLAEKCKNCSTFLRNYSFSVGKIIQWVREPWINWEPSTYGLTNQLEINESFWQINLGLLASEVKSFKSQHKWRVKIIFPFCLTQSRVWAEVMSRGDNEKLWYPWPWLEQFSRRVMESHLCTASVLQSSSQSVVMVRQDAAVVAQIISISAVYQGHILFKRR